MFTRRTLNPWISKWLHYTKNKTIHIRTVINIFLSCSPKQREEVSKFQGTLITLEKACNCCTCQPHGNRTLSPFTTSLYTCKCRVLTPRRETVGYSDEFSQFHWKQVALFSKYCFCHVCTTGLFFTCLFFFTLIQNTRPHKLIFQERDKPERLNTGTSASQFYSLFQTH